jgi:hypothetical protein
MLLTGERFFRVFAFVMIMSTIMMACTTSPVIKAPENGPAPIIAPAESAPKPVVVEPAPLPAEPVPFDPSTVSVELKQTTFVNVQELILGLNKIIQAKDFEGWSNVLTQDYRQHYSSAETLAKLSESSVLKRQGVVLKSLEDYFKFVVYPSRQNDRVDDIEFIEPAKIRAILVNPKGERLVLYNLEKIGDTWKIAIWR